VKKATVTLALLEKHFAAGETVTVAALLQKRAVTKNAKRAGVKVVATGTLSKMLILSKGITCSAGAKEMIEKQGGKVAE
jgi:ribosomal protein L15